MNMEPRNVTYFETPQAFRGWLAKNHASSDELWVGYWKKSVGQPSIAWEESVDEALCFGWIDGIRKRIDDRAFTIRFTPRRAKSIWSSRNLERFAELSAAGRVSAAGHAAFRKRVEARSEVYSYEQGSEPQLPADYVARLRENRAGWLDWESRPPGYRRQVAHWVMSAKRESTRERRLAALIEDSAAGRKIKPLR
ncbi:MAG: hypothetical protein DHS20C21_00410 [Gemmatimonadota bacterium]|nr:MAG: hypothetical protein DHS20C21_00410 [Gemmatimonadota bacterium]